MSYYIHKNGTGNVLKSITDFMGEYNNNRTKVAYCIDMKTFDTCIIDTSFYREIVSSCKNCFFNENDICVKFDADVSKSHSSCVNFSIY